MAKIPVHKTVVRNGQVHVQTYWEGTDAGVQQPSILASLGVSLPPKQRATQRVIDPVLENEWLTAVGEDGMDDYVQAALDAGLGFSAAAELAKSLPEWTSLSDHVYDNGLDQMPRPKGGWQPARLGDQRTDWLRSEVPLETAVEWIDAGFKSPWGGIPDLIKAGVSLERAVQWEKDYQEETGRFDGARLRNAYHELTSGIELEEALKYRREIYGDTKTRLTSTDLLYWKHGFDPATAGRWAKLADRAVSIEQVEALIERKWSPSSVKTAMKDMTGNSGKYVRMDHSFAFALRRLTDVVGSPKDVLKWATTLRPHMDGYMLPQDVLADVARTEEFKKRLLAETGYKAESEDDNYTLLPLTPEEQDITVGILNDPDCSGRDPENLRLAARMSRMLRHTNNLRVLREHGFPLGRGGDVVGATYGAASVSDDASLMDEATRNRYLKGMAVDMYSTRFWNRDERSRWIDDESISPVALKDALLADPNIDSLKLDAVLVADITPSVAGGWL